MHSPDFSGNDARPTWSALFFSVALFALAFLIRMAVLLALRDLTIGPTGPVSGDDVEFNQFALSMARGNGYVDRNGLPSSFRAPGFPIFLAGVHALSGFSYSIAYITLCLLGALACVLTYGLAREIFDEKWARATGLLSVFYLPHIYFSTVFLSEVLFVPCLTVAVWLYVRYIRSANLWIISAAGLVLGWTALVRPFALLLLPIFVALLFYFHWQTKKRALVAAIIFSVTFFAVIVPWTIRNQNVHGRFVLITTNGGSTFYGGNNQRVVTELRHLGSWLSTTELPHRDLIDAQPNEVAHDKMEWKLGIDWIRQNPQYLPLMFVYKLVRLWIWVPDFDAGFRLLRLITYFPYWVLMSIGVIRCLRHRWGWKFPWLVIHGVMLATVVTALIFWGSPRFRDANLPFLMFYATVGLQAITTSKSRNKTSQALGSIEQ